MPHHVPDKVTVVMDGAPFSFFVTVTDSRSVYDTGVAAHYVHELDPTMAANPHARRLHTASIGELKLVTDNLWEPLLLDNTDACRYAQVVNSFHSIFNRRWYTPRATELPPLASNS